MNIGWLERKAIINIDYINSTAKDLTNLPKLKVFLQNIIPCPTHQPFVRITLNIVNYYNKARYISNIILMKNKKHIFDTKYNYSIAIKQQRMHLQDIENRNYHNEIEAARKKYLSPIKLEGSNKPVNFDRFSFTQALKRNIKGIQYSLFLRAEAKINQKYHKDIYSVGESLLNNDHRFQQKLDDQSKANKYQSHNFTEPRLLKPNNELTISYWINKNSVPNKIVIRAGDPISFIMKKHVYKIKY